MDSEFRSIRHIRALVTEAAGGKADQIADISIHVQTEIADYVVVEDEHSSFCHATFNYLEL